MIIYYKKHIYLESSCHWLQMVLIFVIFFWSFGHFWRETSEWGNSRELWEKPNQGLDFKHCFFERKPK